MHALISRIGESFQKTFQQHVKDLEVHECLTFGRCLQENFKEKSSTRMMTLDSVRSSEFYQKFIEFCDPCIGVVVIFVQKTLKFIGFGSCSPTAHIFASTCYIYLATPSDIFAGDRGPIVTMVAMLWPHGQMFFKVDGGYTDFS